MSWNSIIGQTHIKDNFRPAIANKRLAHAYLFSGPEGTGKSAFALELAMVLNCDKKKVDACSTCPSCLKFESLQHPNLHLVFPLPVGKNEKYGDDPLAKLSDDDIAMIQEEIHRKATNRYHQITVAKANSIKVNSVREIRKESSMSMFEEGKRVFIILNAEDLTDEAANALLKTLEEPHEDTLLILTTSQPDRLLPTIISRCQHVRFGPIDEQEIKKTLISQKDIPEKEAMLIAKLSNGRYGKALALTETVLKEWYTQAIVFLRKILYGSRQELLAEIDRLVSEYERAELEEFLLMLQSWLHDAMLVKAATRMKKDLIEGDTIEKFVLHHPNVNYPSLVESIQLAISVLNKNVYIPLVLINLAIELREQIVTSSEEVSSSPQQ